MIERRWKVVDRNNPPKGAVNVDVGDHFEYCVLQTRCWDKDYPGDGLVGGGWSDWSDVLVEESND